MESRTLRFGLYRTKIFARMLELVVILRTIEGIGAIIFVAIACMPTDFQIRLLILTLVEQLGG